jgi:hypothetical protein
MSYSGVVKRQAIDAASVRAYLDRPWRKLTALKVAHWRGRKARGGIAEVLRVAGQLRSQARLLDPSWPPESERGEDFETHQRIAEALARTPRATGRRGVGKIRSRRVR